MKTKQPETVEEQVEMMMEFFQKWLDDLEIGSDTFSEEAYEMLKLNSYFDMFQYHQRLLQEEQMKKQQEEQEKKKGKIIVPDTNENVVEGNFNK